MLNICIIDVSNVRHMHNRAYTLRGVSPRITGVPKLIGRISRRADREGRAGPAYADGTGQLVGRNVRTRAAFPTAGFASALFSARLGGVAAGGWEGQATSTRWRPEAFRSRCT